MDAQPRLLQQIVRIRAVRRLQLEETVQLRADPMDERAGGAEVARLVAGHQDLWIAVHIQDNSLQAREKLRPGDLISLKLRDSAGT
jgi:hypothetical protein